MDNFKAEDYNSISLNNMQRNYYRSKDLKTIAVYTTCQCQRTFYQLWKPATFNCNQCNEIADLKQKNVELEKNLVNVKNDYEEKIKSLEAKLQATEMNENENSLENLCLETEEVTSIVSATDSQHSFENL